MKVFLVGFMGAGKTTVGARLAERLQFPFFDLDELIETAEGMSVREIFEARGEAYFRKRESDLLSSTGFLEHGVIATGGGTFTFDENFRFIQGEGLSVYLSAPFGMLRMRMDGKQAERPLFRDDRATHELYQSRLRSYKRADVTLEIHESETPLEIVERLVFELPKEFLRMTTVSQGRGW